MAFTGISIYKELQGRVAQSYTGFVSSAKATRLLRQGLYDAIEDKWRLIQRGEDVKAYDEVRTYINANQNLELTNNFVSTFTGTLQNYMRMLSVKVLFNDPIYSVRISAQTTTTPTVLTFSGRSNIRNEKVLVPAWGEVFLRKINVNQFAVYQDATLQNPDTITNNVIGLNISRVFYEYAKQLSSVEKISRLINPSPDKPYYEVTNGGLLFYPTNIVATECTLDYIKKVDEIDVTSNQDYEQLYPYKFLSFVIEKSAIAFGAEARDNELVILSNQDLQQNS